MTGLPGTELPNDPGDNPCFGCGPRHPFGLRLRFFDDGTWVRAQLHLDDRYCGWPGQVLDGILFGAMSETIYWTAWARFGALASGNGRPTVEFLDFVQTGKPFTVEARRTGAEGDGWRFEARIVQDGREAARMSDRLWPMRADEAKRLLERFELPRTVREEVEAIATGTTGPRP